MIDDKLKDILKYRRLLEIGSKEAIAQIKQAFADEGYRSTIEEVLPELIEVWHKQGYMTGREWFDKTKINSITELEPMPHEFRNDGNQVAFNLIDQFNKRIKKASGIE